MKALQLFFSLKSIKEFIWPIKRDEIKKFLPMSLMYLFALFNYNALRSIKDSLIVPHIGAEALSFVKLYLVVPSAVIFVLIYARLSNSFSLRVIYHQVAAFYIIFFLLFGFVIFPNLNFFHLEFDNFEELMRTEVDLLAFSVSLSHFKWFLLIFSKWSFSLFYILAELWGSSMMFLLFWQFANQITFSEEAKRFYPMFGFIGGIGTFSAGVTVKLLFSMFEKMGGAENFTVANMQILMVIVSLGTVVILLLFNKMNNMIQNNQIKYHHKINQIKKKLPLRDSLKIVLSSKYLGYVVVLVLCYGFTINLLEGPWKNEVRKVYPESSSYMNFMGTLNILNGSVSMFFMLIGASVLKKYSWFTAAIATPIIIFITGTAFFLFVVFGEMNSAWLLSVFAIDPAFLAVVIGTAQNVLSKSTKYAFHDPTKEMTYIPIDEELKSKGKAAVDVLGARFSKSLGAFVQSSVFMIFPNSTYSSISWILMIIFIAVAIVWMIDVKVLNKEYLKQVRLQDYKKLS